MDIMTRLITPKHLKTINYKRGPKCLHLFILTDTEDKEYKIFPPVKGLDILHRWIAVNVSYYETDGYYVGETDRVVTSFSRVDEEPVHVKEIKNHIKFLQGVQKKYGKC